MHEHLKSDDDLFPRPQPDGLPPINPTMRVWKTDRLSEADRLCIEEIIRSNPLISEDEISRLAAQAIERQPQATVSTTHTGDPEMPAANDESDEYDPAVLDRLLAALDEPPSSSSKPTDESRSTNSATTEPAPPSIPTGESPTPRAFPVGASDPYQFIPLDLIDKTREEVSTASTESILKLLADVSREYDGLRKLSAIWDARERACALSIVLNERSDNSPRFRPMSVPPKFIKGSDYDIASVWLARDRQVIDLHWLFLQASAVPGETYAPLFRAETFDFALAAKIAATNWKAETKAKEIGHGEFTELLCGSLCTRHGRERWRTIREGEDRVRRLLSDKVRDPRSRVQVNDVSNWISVYRALMIGRSSPTLAREALKWMGRPQLAPSTLKDKLNTLRRWGLDMRGKREGPSVE